MFTDKTLCSKYFSFFSFRSFGYAKKKALRLAAQAFAFNYNPTFLNNFKKNIGFLKYCCYFYICKKYLFPDRAN